MNTRALNTALTSEEMKRNVEGAEAQEAERGC